MDFNSKITGTAELDKVFAKMTRSTRRKAHMQSLRAGAKVVKEAATVNIRKQFNVHTGVLSKKSTIAIYNGKKYKGNYRVMVSIKRGLVNNMIKARNKVTGAVENVRVGLYAAVGEYGSTKLNRRPRPWIRPAIRENEVQAVSELRREFSSRISDVLRDAKN